MPQFVQTEQQKELIASLIQDLPAYRKKMRMSQAELGDAVGKSRQKISEMERGTAPLGWDTYLAIFFLSWAHMAFWSPEDGTRSVWRQPES